MNVLCLMIDGLHWGYLGALGNTWVATPAIDRLAAEGFVFESAFASTPDLDTLYRAFWQGVHPLSGAGEAAHPPLTEALRQRGVHCCLASDEPRIVAHPLAASFDEIEELPAAMPTEPAESVDGTLLAQGFAGLIRQLAAAEPPFLVWIHLAALGRVWDAPWPLRRQFQEEGDPEPYGEVAAPERFFAEPPDPDELLPFSHAYAAQVAVLDGCVGALVDFLASHPAGKDTTLVLGGVRGFPLGEHRRLGPCDEALYGERMQVPLVIRLPDTALAGGRSHALVHSPDLWATLRDAWDVTSGQASLTGRSLLPLIRGEQESLRDRIVLTDGDRRRAIVTPGWHLRKDEPVELFTRPDDLWQVNDVHSRCAEVAEGLAAEIAVYEEALREGRPPATTPLAESLAEPCA